ncbi:hypothetical protein [Anaerotruncus rubiinfantis]
MLEGISFEMTVWQLFDFLLAIAVGACTTKNEDFEYKNISLFHDGMFL